MLLLRCDTSNLRVDRPGTDGRIRGRSNIPQYRKKVYGRAPPKVRRVEDTASLVRILPYKDFLHEIDGQSGRTHVCTTAVQGGFVAQLCAEEKGMATLHVICR